ncbi:hypothetical protein [Paracoccus sp. KR1-242]|uniref:hypothetical protein n=1 Tax=Paracoccus sp. KR1-242 TaxID=3410028 RepID=UPI003BFC6E00
MRGTYYSIHAVSGTPSLVSGAEDGAIGTALLRQQSTLDRIDKPHDYFLADRHREVCRRPRGPANRRLRHPGNSVDYYQKSGQLASYLAMTNICEEWMLRFLVLLLCCASPAFAQGDDVPRLPNGKVDVVAVMSSFKMVSPVFENAPVDEFDGEILGKSFHAAYAQAETPDFFVLAIRSSNLSQEATYLTALMLTDAICLRKNRRPGEVKWDDTSIQVGPDWKVTSSCSTEIRP